DAGEDVEHLLAREVLQADAGEVLLEQREVMRLGADLGQLASGLDRIALQRDGRHVASLLRSLLQRRARSGASPKRTDVCSRADPRASLERKCRSRPDFVHGSLAGAAAPCSDATSGAPIARASG